MTRKYTRNTPDAKEAIYKHRIERMEARKVRILDRIARDRVRVEEIADRQQRLINRLRPVQQANVLG